MAHTPGPWRIEKQDPNADFTAIGGPIAVVGGEATYENIEFVIGESGDWGPHGDAVTTANAYLIAAAPDLLAACEKLVARIESDIEWTGNLTDEGDAGRAAIAKAKGV